VEDTSQHPKSRGNTSQRWSWVGWSIFTVSWSWSWPSHKIFSVHRQFHLIGKWLSTFWREFSAAKISEHAAYICLSEHAAHICLSEHAAHMPASILPSTPINLIGCDIIVN
jgi:hypothetical protein